MANIPIGGYINNSMAVPNDSKKYGPYSASGQKSALQVAFETLDGDDVLCVGLTVGIINEDGSIDEYWFKTACESVTDLVKKSQGSGGSGDIPTKMSDLTNDVGYITSSDIPSIPSKTSDLTNDSGFITESDIPTIPTKVSELTNDENYVKSSELPSVPTKTSQLTNDSGFLTEHQDISGKEDKLTGDKLSAVQSGITSGKVAEYDSMKSNVDALMAQTFPLVVGYSGCDNGTYENGTNITPTIKWTAKRQGADVVPSNVVVTSDFSGTLASDKKSYIVDSLALTSTKKFNAKVSQGGQDKNLGEIAWVPSFYRYYGEIDSMPTDATIASVIKARSKALSTSQTLGDKNSPIKSGANKYYIFAVKSNSAINWVVNNATGGTVSGATIGSKTLEQENGYQSNTYQYIIIPPSPTGEEWSFYLTVKNS